MARNRHKKSQVKPSALANEHPVSKPAFHTPPAKPSAAAQKVAGQILSGGSEYLMKNFERIMIDSEKLAGEPEFAGLSFNRDQAVKITERWLKKYQARLTEAERKSQKEFQQVSDDMKIKIIDELSTPAFRRDVKRRLQALNDRIMTTNDAKKIEMAMILQALMSMKELPWGLCGLILTIYNRTMKEEWQTYQDENEMFNAVTEALKGEGEEKIDVRNISSYPTVCHRMGLRPMEKGSELAR